jgi:hypothetical protein
MAGPRRAGAVVVAAVLLAGCGGRGGAPSAATERRAVRATVRTFMRALAAADGASACAALTGSGQSSVIATIGPELGNFGIDSCAQVVQVTGAQLGAGLRRELAGAQVGAVALHGVRATVRWSAVTSPSGDIAAYFGRAEPIDLVETDGSWKISAL